MESSIQEPVPASVRKVRHQPEYAIYKPNNRGNGGVFRFSINRDKNAVFVEAACQSGERLFDWESKIIMKWGLSDLGQILAALQGRQTSAKLFHQSEKANSICELSNRNDPERAPWWIALSRQESSASTARKVGIPMTHSEASILECALRSAVGRILRW